MQKSSHKRPPSHATYSNIEFDPEFNASPAKRKIGYLKTHKCASSTIQNILLRYVLHNDLNVALPVRGNYLGYKQMFDRKLMRSALWEKANLKYDMFLVHTRWNHTRISQLLDDQGDVFYFSIVRDPVELFRSYWDYYNLTSLSNMTLETYTRTTIY